MSLIAQVNMVAAAIGLLGITAMVIRWVLREGASREGTARRRPATRMRR